MNTERMLLRIADVRRRYGGVSGITIDRWMADQRVAFPRPIRAGNLQNSHRLWDSSELDAFDSRQRASAGK